MLIEWHDSLLVGFEPIDREHMTLVSLINHLHDDVKAGRDRNIVDDALFSLADQVAAHFNQEDVLMRAYAYKDRADHLLEHRKLIEQLDILLDGMDMLTDQILLEAIAFMDRWFTDHVVNSDARLGAYLRDKVQPAGAVVGTVGLR